VVLEDQTRDRDDDHHDADDDQPRLPERQRQAEQSSRRGDPDGPVATRAEEAQLTGAVADLGVLVVLGTGLDPASDEPEVAPHQQCQTTGQQERDRADRLDAVVRHLRGQHPVDDGDDETEDRDDVENPSFDLHERVSFLLDRWVTSRGPT
jgi:hypothetical protein